jgi:hypothetical protein
MKRRKNQQRRRPREGNPRNPYAIACQKITGIFLLIMEILDGSGLL